MVKNNNINKKLPDDYNHLVDQSTYSAIIDTILQYFTEKGEPVVKVEEGYIITVGDEEDSQERRYGLDNLVRMVAASKKEDRESVIYSHFNRAFYDARPLEYFKTDYEMAKQYLKILIKPEDMLKQQGGANVVHKTVLPGTCSILVFDYDNKFTFLYRNMVQAWGKTDDELFEEALNNIGNEDIQVVGVKLPKPGQEQKEEEDGDEVSEDIEDARDQDAFVFINPDFAAPVVCIMDEKTPFTIGQFGSIVAIPCKGYALAAPINNPEILNMLGALSVLVVKFFDEQPGNITTDFYWYYQNKFRLMTEIPSTEKEGYRAVKLPKELIQLLKEQ